MISPRVEVVLINYRRPKNISRVVSAFRAQTVPCRITLIDSAVESKYKVSKKVRGSVDHFYRWRMNFGPYTRYVPMAAYSCEYTYFHDDDMLPGKRLLEHFLGTADSLGAFGVLGQQGRNVGPNGDYVFADADGEASRVHTVARSTAAVPVDVVVRGFFVATRHLPAMLELKNRMGIVPDTELEDDLLLCTSMNLVLGLTNFIVPAHPDPQTRMDKKELSADYARQGRGHHFAERTRFCKAAIALGWRPLNGKSAAAPVPVQGRSEHPVGIAGPESVPIPRPVELEQFDSRAYWIERGKGYLNEERLFTETYRRQEQFILDSLNNAGVRPSTILEIGCGFGRMTKRLAEAYPTATIVACDISLDQLRNAREYCAEFADRVSFQQYDFYSDEPIPGDRFDLAIAVEVFLHHPYDRVRAFVSRLTGISTCVANYDWSEPGAISSARHVWVHDYGQMYRDIGIDPQVFVEPQLIIGQQQKLFVACQAPASSR